MKTFILAILALYSFARYQEDPFIKRRKLLEQEQAIQKQLLDSNKEFILDFSGLTPAAGQWAGHMLSLRTSETGLITLAFKRKKNSPEISGYCNLHYARFLAIDADPEERLLEDSLRSLKDEKPWREYVHKRHIRDSTFNASYDEVYPVSGYVKKDSIFFQIDTVYPNIQKGHLPRERHYRFQGKCMKWTYTYNLDTPIPFIIGTYIDSAFQSLPGFGTFMMNKEY